MSKSKGFNLADLDTIEACNKPFEFEIKSVSGKPTGFFISVLGRDSDVYRGRVKAIADEGLRLAAVGKPNPNAASIDKLEAKNIDAMVAATVSWRLGDSKTVPLGDEELECTPENVRKVYERLLPVRNQVLEAINDVENFTRG